MKNKKLRLNELKVKSFVIQSGSRFAETIKGGDEKETFPTDVISDPNAPSGLCSPLLTEGVFCQPQTQAVCGFSQIQCTQQGAGCSNDHRCRSFRC